MGAELSERLGPGDVVVVSGEVGAGKTTLIRGACRALGVEGPVTSPTFTIGQRYEGGRLPIAHLDLYRLEDLPGAESRPWLIDLLHWGNPLTPAIEAYRAPLYAGELPPAADTLYLCVAAVVALALGALVFSSVDDRIASEA